jgi:hypothetical protein
MSGWAADRNNLNTSITVTLWDPATSTSIASTTANAARPDVGSYLGDNGLHGFSIQLPTSYANGLSHTLQLRFASSSSQLGGSPFSLTCGSSGSTTHNYLGSVDSASCSGINGWAADRNRLNVPIVVSLWDPSTGNTIASTTANASRTDVGSYLGDNGLHGFSLQLPSSYVNGVNYTLQLRFESSSTQLAGSPVTLNCGSVAGATNYAGHVDSATCSGISGWIADVNRPNVSILVTLWDVASQTGQAVAWANAFRSDIGSQLGDNGLHGFTIPIPARLANGDTRTLQIRYESSSTQVAGSPFTLACGSLVIRQYTGNIDSATCAGITGWAADRTRLNVPLVVNLTDPSNGLVIASTIANLSRPDVGASLGDNGMHGFTFPVPPGYATGNTYTLAIYYEGATTSTLPGSPFTLNCGSFVSSNYSGAINSATCSGVTGWAADLSRPNVPIPVSLWDDHGTEISGNLAVASRGDVISQTGDNGLHGYTLQVPGNYADGTAHTYQIRYASTATQLPGSPITLTCGTLQTPQYTGAIESHACSGITGWAADRLRPNESIIVTLWDLASGNQIASTLANTYRSDIATLLGDSGRHGYSLQIPASFANGVTYTFEVRYESSTTQLPGSPVILTCGSGSGGSTLLYTGNVDASSCSGIVGWAADRNRLNQAITVTLVDSTSGSVVSTTTANSYRADVGAVLGDNGLHGYSLQVPFAGTSKTYSVHFESSATPVNGSPVTLTCGETPNYTGSVDVLNCSTIAGWAADRNALNTSIIVELYDGSSPFFGESANVSRPDVGAALGDNGLHGFSFPTPAGLKDGKAHTLTLRPGLGSNVVFPGPQSLTCQP